VLDEKLLYYVDRGRRRNGISMLNSALELKFKEMGLTKQDGSTTHWKAMAKNPPSHLIARLCFNKRKVQWNLHAKVKIKVKLSLY
jgi:hypothetical protein